MPSCTTMPCGTLSASMISSISQPCSTYSWYGSSSTCDSACAARNWCSTLRAWVLATNGYTWGCNHPMHPLPPVPAYLLTTVSCIAQCCLLRIHPRFDLGCVVWWSASTHLLKTQMSWTCPSSSALRMASNLVCRGCVGEIPRGKLVCGLV